MAVTRGEGKQREDLGVSRDAEEEKYSRGRRIGTIRDN